jgi:hypothetical protein
VKCGSSLWGLKEKNLLFSENSNNTRKSPFSYCILRRNGIDKNVQINYLYRFDEEDCVE